MVKLGTGTTTRDTQHRKCKGGVGLMCRINVGRSKGDCCQAEQHLSSQSDHQKSKNIECHQIATEKKMGEHTHNHVNPNQRHMNPRENLQATTAKTTIPYDTTQTHSDTDTRI